MGRALNDARLEMVARHYAGPLVDIGVGCGQFVESRPATSGYDINPAAVTWLLDRGLFVDPYHTVVRAVTFWDSLEHIPNPGALLCNVTSFVFVALPIFTNLDHVLHSKHYRPDEHCWYFTDAGFVWFMEQHGWRVLEVNAREIDLGREGILSFAFARD